ncbi:ABC transporter permease [Mucilaginibacter calamicampi]|uniref:ABC transporter permease n=1 Tax=Mucilaginibacter calamicampi TaxID=1302352 RepID=A0ABW2Z2A5_9SPHI
MAGFFKRPQFTFLNVMGLAIGLACTLLMYLWVSDELSIDRFNQKDGRLYQVLKNAPNSDGSISTYETTQGLLATSMRADLPEVENAVSVRKDRGMGVLTLGDKPIKAQAEFVGNEFFDVFSYPLIEGNGNKPFAGHDGILLSDKLALKLFNTTSGLVGKTLTWDHGDQYNGTYTINGVFQSPPANATDQFDVLFSYDLYASKEAGRSGDISNWGSSSVYTYVVLKDGADIAAFNSKVKDYTKLKMKGLSEGIIKWEGNIFLQRYSDRHLYNQFENGVLTGGKIEYVRLFSIIAVFILIIACINFMNLSTARASKRLKEVGIKKVAGATRWTLALQYITESFLIVLLSLVVAGALIVLSLPAFKQITGKDISLIVNANLIISVVLIGIITSIIAGSYPAFYLSGLKPSLVLKGQQKTSFSEIFVRKGLVIFQFSISIILIVAVCVVYQQMNLIQNKNLGYNKDNIIRFASEGKLRGNIPGFISGIKNIQGVVSASSMDGNMTGQYSQGGGMIDWEGKSRGEGEGIRFEGLDMDYGMMELLDLKMGDGRRFSNDYADSSSVILNETAVAAMGLKHAVGQTITVWGKKRQIVGVIKDFHFESLHTKIPPFFLRPAQDNANIFVKIKAGTERETLARLGSFYKQYNMGLPFNFTFIDEDYQALYASEERIQSLSKYFAGVGIIISCLGLFGLASFTAQKRRKEIGIRKVIGATANSVVMMLSKDFLKLVTIALLIAFPSAWWLMNSWLNGFAYRTHIGAEVFLIVGALVVVIAWLTVSSQAIKAALTNPVNSLRSE